MSLNEKLESFKADFMKQVPDEAKVIVGRNMQALLDSGQHDTVPSNGASFPAVTLRDSSGNDHRLGNGASTPQAISFFRGFW